MPGKILLLSHNFYPEPVGIGKYNGEMVDWLLSKGYDCTVVTTFPYYPFWKVQSPYNNHWYKKEVIYHKESGAKLTVYRCPSFIPANPTGWKRALQDFSFIISKFWMMQKIVMSGKKFDLIVAIAPPFHLAYLGLMLRNRRGGKLVYHIQDMQIEAAQRLNMLSGRSLLKRLFAMEYKILSQADFVSSISHGMIARIRMKIDREVLFFPNWVDVTAFYPIDDRKALKERWGYQSDDFVSLYSGSIGEKQGIEDLLEAARALHHEPRFKFIVCASGPYQEKLAQRAEEMMLKNIVFHPLQDKQVFNEYLNMADLHLVLQRWNAGDLVMPSKLSTILAVGGASLVTSLPRTSLFDLVNDHSLGYIVEPGDGMLLAEKIREIALDPQLPQKRVKARAYAEDFLSIDKVMGNFAEIVLEPEPVLTEPGRRRTLDTLPVLDYPVLVSPVKLVGLDTGRVINTLNQYSYMVAEKDPAFKNALLASDILVPDGVGIVAAARILEGKKIRKIAGFDVHMHFLKRLNASGGGCFYLGSSEETLDEIRKKITRQFPRIRVGTYSPPFRSEFSDEENRTMVDAINRFAPDVLFVGMTAPKQEKWVQANKDRLNTPVICSVGAVFDFYGGTAKRPGKIWRSLGLEWLGRLMYRPQRLWKRYLYYGPAFVYVMLRHKLAGRNES